MQRLAVHRRAGPHVVGDIGDRDADDEAAGIFRVGIGHGMHGVVVVLGVGRIDGDERQLAPILAAGERRRHGGLRLRSTAARKDVRDAVGVDGDQADRALALERAELFLDRARVGKTIAAPASATSTATRSPSLASAPASAGIASSRPSCFLSIGASRPPPPGSARKMPSTRCLARSMILMTRPVWRIGVVLSPALLDPQQRAVADAGDLARPGAAGDAAMRIFGGGAVRLLVPFGRDRDQFAVACRAP